MIKILVTGDYCPRDRVAELIDNKKYNDVFENVTPLIKNADYAVVNFECPVVTDNNAVGVFKIGPNLRCSEKAVEAIKKTGFDLVTLANNHIYDFGNEGVIDTLFMCEKYGIDSVGAGKNLIEAQKVFYKSIKDKKIAFVNFCENEFSIASKDNAGANPLNIVANYYQIQEAKQNADYVIVIIHGGHEYYQLPSPRMKETYRFFAETGANVIINHHQHCYSGYEVYKDIPIFYGLGNFCFDTKKYKNSTWNKGYMVQLLFDNEKVSFDLIPYTQCKEKPRVEISENDDSFYSEIARLNEIISDDKALWESFFYFAHERKENILSILEPYDNRYLKSLWRRKLLPSFVSKKKKNLILNIVRCEAHREIFLNVLDNKNVY
jgi:poly-gamma-glutamate synthesis protein (capsule biosynthesis protein)